MTVFKHMKPGSFFNRVGLILLTIILFSFSASDYRSQYRIPLVAYSVTAGDIDLDGDNDIVVGHNYSFQTEWSGVSIMLNDGNGYFSLYDSVFLFAGQSSIILENVNSDPRKEIIAKYIDAQNENEYIAIINDFDLSSIAYFSMNTYEGVRSKTTGDINGDGYEDIVFASHDGQFWGFLLNDGSGEFASPWYINVEGYYPSDIACADLNDDGWDDVVVTGQKTEVYFSYPGSFNELLLEYSWYGDISIADFDHDGDLDILTIGGLGTTFLRMHENRGNNTFFSHDVFSFQPYASRFFISDFDNDNFPDLLFPLSDNSGFLIYYNQGDFLLGDSLFIAVEPNEYEGLRNCFCCDLDGNNYNDIIITRHAQIALPDNLVLLFNDGNGNFVENPVSIFEEQIPEPPNPIVCYPNPFLNQLTIEINSNASDLENTIEIYDTKGSLVKAIDRNSLRFGNHKVIWNGKDLSGNVIKPGTYIVCLQMGGNKYVQRIIKLPY